MPTAGTSGYGIACTVLSIHPGTERCVAGPLAFVDNRGVNRTYGSARPRVRKVIAFVVSATLLGCAALPYLDLAGWVPIAQALVPVAALAVALAVLGYLTVSRGRALRRQDPAAIATVLVAAIAVVAMLWPVFVWHRAGPAPPTADAVAAAPRLPYGAPTLSVVSLNTEFGQADPASIVALVGEKRVDLLVLLEATPTLWTQLQDAGLAPLLPHATGTVRTDAGGTIIASNNPLRCGQVIGEHCPGVRSQEGQTGPTAFDQPVARLLDGTVVRATHPWPPGVDSSRWRAEQSQLATWLGEQGSRPLVVAGDLNAGPVHPAFRSMVDVFEHAPRRGVPWPRTWPQETLLPAFVLIDHVLAQGRVVVDEAVVAVDGSDHAAVWALLEPAGR